jgi:hypothetical protein
MSNAINAHGTLLYRNGTAVGELRDLVPPALVLNTFDVSNQNDSDNAYVVGIRRTSEMTATINMLLSGDASHGTASTGLVYAYVNRSKDRYNVVYPDGSGFMFSGFMANFAPNAPVDGPLEAKITVRPTNGITITP